MLICSALKICIKKPHLDVVDNKDYTNKKLCKRKYKTNEVKHNLNIFDNKGYTKTCKRKDNQTKSCQMAKYFI